MVALPLCSANVTIIGESMFGCFKENFLFGFFTYFIIIPEFEISNIIYLKWEKNIENKACSEVYLGISFKFGLSAKTLIHKQ